MPTLITEKSKVVALVDFKTEVMFGAVISGITGLIGGWDSTVRVLLILMFVDVISGLFKGFYLSCFSSRQFREGLMNKAGFFLVIILAYQLDVLLGNSESFIRNIAVMFYIGVEGTSLLENLSAVGVPIPNFIKKRLSALKDANDDIETEQTVK